MSNKQAERASVRDVSPTGRDSARPGSSHDSPSAKGGTPQTFPALWKFGGSRITYDRLRELEKLGERHYAYRMATDGRNVDALSTPSAQPKLAVRMMVPDKHRDWKIPAEAGLLFNPDSQH